MSNKFARIPLRAAGDKRLQGADLRVLIAIASYADAKTLECYPSQETIRKHMGWKRNNQVSKAVSRLVAAGYLKKVVKKGSYGQFPSNLYKIILKFEDEPNSEESASSPISDTVMGGNSPKGEKSPSPRSDSNIPTKHTNNPITTRAGAILKSPARLEPYPILMKTLQSMGLNSSQAGECLITLDSDTYEKIEDGLQNKSLTYHDAAQLVIEGSI